MSRPYCSVVPAQLDWHNGVPVSKMFGDIYFSLDNGLAESKHVFIDGNHLIERWQRLSPGGTFSIFETGFGTGLNFLLTVKLWQAHAPKSAKLFYYSCENHPLTKSDLKQALSLWPELESHSVSLLNHYPHLIPGFHTLYPAENVTLTLIFSEAEQSLCQLFPGGEETIDCWYLDGFTPAKNPMMWCKNIFQRMGYLSHSDSTAATFSCAKVVKDGLEQAGFIIQKQPGYGRKRHMLTATSKPKGGSQSKRYPHSIWQYGHKPSGKIQSAVIIGAGLAGSMMASLLANRGCQVTVFDEHPEPAQSASANTQAVLFPGLSAFDSPLSQLMMQAYQYAVAFYQRMDLTEVDHQLDGMIYFDEKLARQGQEKKINWLKHLFPLVEHMSAEELSEKAGLEVTQSGLWFPDSGWINSQQLCRALLTNPNIHFKGECFIDAFTCHKQGWHVSGIHADVLILANGWQLKQDAMGAYLPLRAIKGQMTSFEATAQSAKLKVPVCGHGHVLPCVNGRHQTGATYQIDVYQGDHDPSEDQSNLGALLKLPLQCAWQTQIMGSWSGVRTTTNDYLPIVGQLPDMDAFRQNFTGLSKDANRYINNQNPFYRNLYAMTGFGSKGLTSIPLCAEHLARQICSEPPILPNHLLSAISPARFLQRNIIRSRNAPTG